MPFTRDDFPSFYHFNATRQARIDRFESMLEVLNHAVEQGSIRNVEFKDLKSYFSNASEDAFRLLVSEPFMYAGQWESQPKEVYDAGSNLGMSGITGMFSAKKKVDKLTVDNDCVRAMKQWVNEYLPLAEAVDSLKANVVKGRAPSTGPAKPVNPNKDVKTCPCCFRAIAVAGTMVHHGYKRPGQGEQTRSCPGINFQPLELSPKGLVYMAEMHEATIAGLKEKLELAPQIQKFTKTIRKQEVTITRDDPQFESTMAGHVWGIERDIRWNEQDLQKFQNCIATWKPAMTHERVQDDNESPAP
jgi:hypothetical protein